MKRTLWIWTALCAVILVFAFFALPAWDTNTEGWELFSGEEVFFVIAILVGIAWLVGLGILATTVALVRFIRRDGGGRAWWGRRGKSGKASIIVLVAASVVTLVLVAARIPREGDETSDATQVATRLVWKHSASWSPDGKRIALVRGPEKVCGGDIYVVNAQGGKPRRITSLSDSERGSGLLSPAWSPDGKKFAFSLAAPGYADICGEYEIDVIDSDGSGRARLTRESRVGVVDGACHSWSPNGRWIVFAEPDAPFDWVVVMKADGTKLRRLARTSLFAGCPVWSPDGRRIAFVRGKPYYGVGDISGEVYVVELDGGEKRLTRTHGTASSPTWAPNGSQLAFITADEADSIRTVRSDGSAQRRIAVERGHVLLDDLTWSPDGRRMAYYRSAYRSNDEELVVIGSDGSDRRVLANRCCLVWSPDGTRVAVGTNRSGRIYVVRADQFGLTGKLRRVLKD